MCSPVSHTKVARKVHPLVHLAPVGPQGPLPMHADETSAEGCPHAVPNRDACSGCGEGSGVSERCSGRVVRVVAALPCVVLAFAAMTSAARAQTTPRPFRHATHTTFECTQCHRMTTQHGALTVTSARDCMACHHAPERATRCTDCHEAAVIGARDGTKQVMMQIAQQPAAAREVPFRHAVHARLECTACHTEPLTFATAPDACLSCHIEHHEPERACASCHAVPVPGAHTRTVHVSCSTAGCHLAQPFEQATRTRTLCLGCHRPMDDHKPGGNCASCHVLPPWGADVSGGSLQGEGGNARDRTRFPD